MISKVFNTALGWAGVAASEKGITRIVLPQKNKKAVERELADWQVSVPEVSANSRESRLLNKAVRLLETYFSGKTVVFDLSLDIRYYTAFQQAVWRTCMQIRNGETRSYGWIAERIKNPQASRAVGQAMGANPIPVIIP